MSKLSTDSREELIINLRFKFILKPVTLDADVVVVDLEVRVKVFVVELVNVMELIVSDFVVLVMDVKDMEDVVAVVTEDDVNVGLVFVEEEEEIVLLV